MLAHASFFILKNVETYMFIIKYSVHVNFTPVYTRNHYLMSGLLVVLVMIECLNHSCKLRQ
jgi:hypothetical protein